ncbi:MAG: TonB-dependent receptor [Gammaproteobacteria bacterium]|nr:TonB-dependent receptor [Gammaproteobacteria bacterium]
MNPPRATTSRTLTAAIGFALALPALAQSPAATDGNRLDEITVTATRREQNLQSVGIAVSTFSGDDLRDLGVTSSNELMNVTPGLRLQEGGGGPIIGLLSIRGVAQNDFAGHIEAPNALYFDDVYQPGISSSIQQFFDVDRVEVLKGPQGTLFGRNATGGLIHIITRRPTDEFEGHLSVGYGSHEQKRATGVLSGPLGDGISARLSFLWNQADGYISNSAGEDLNEDDTSAVRLQLRLAPGDAFEALLSASTYRIDSINTGGAYATAGVADENGLGVALPPGSPTMFGYVDADGDPFTGAFDYPGFLDRQQDDISARLSYRFANGITLRSVTSFSQLDSVYGEDNDLSPVPFTVFRQNAEADYFTQELRLEGESEETRWTAGVFFLDIDGTYLQGFDILALGTTLQADYSLDTRSWSAFVQAEHDLFDVLTVTGGVRYTRDEKDYDYTQHCTGGFCFLFVAPGTLAAAGHVTDSHSEGDWSARLQLDWKPNPDTLLYASVNRGYKAFNYNAGFAGLAPLAGVRFDGETLLAFEVGSKVDFWDNRARLNAAAFYYDYSDYQAFDQRGLNFTLFNADATVYGADFELSLRPGRGVTLQLGTALLHTEVKDVPIGASRLEREAPQSPAATVMAAVAKDFELGFGTLSISANGAWTSSNYSQLTNAPVTKIRADRVVNARVGFTDPERRWELALAVRNLFDRERIIYAFDITGPPLGLIENTLAPPRWITFEARVNF